MKENRIAWNRYCAAHPNELFIEWQDDMNDLFYGKRFRASYNACEVIAAYNALLDLTDHKPDIPFPELLGRFERKGLVHKGAWGTDPRLIADYFLESGYTVHTLTGRQITERSLLDLEKKCKTYIMTAYNDRADISQMIHTVSVTRLADGSFSVHNAGDDRRYESLAQAVFSYKNGHGRVMSILGIS